MKDVRYVMFCSSAPQWLELGLSLRHKMSATPALWLGDDSHYEDAVFHFGSAVVKKLSELRYEAQDERFEYGGTFSEFFGSPEYAVAKDLCIKMMDRLDDASTFTRLDREVWFHNVVMWTLTHFERHVPHALIMSEAPHNHAQYAVFEICKFIGIPILKFSALTPVPCLGAGIWGSGGYMKFAIDETLTSSPEVSHAKEDLWNAFQGYIETTVSRVMDSRDGEAPLYLAILASQKNSRLVRRRLAITLFKDTFRFLKYPRKIFSRSAYKSTNAFNLSPLSIFLITRFRKRVLRTELRRECDTYEKVGSEKYVYYPLHYEPERTTNPDGGIYQDQLINLILLRKFLPSSVNIFVKEHPAQFMIARTGYRGRSPLFYRQIKNIKSIKLFSLSRDQMN